jgi:hypothetical protein
MDSRKKSHKIRHYKIDELLSISHEIYKLENESKLLTEKQGEI